MRKDQLARVNFIGESPAFVAALDLVTRFAACDATVLIQGETGTGKELAARAVHYLSDRAPRPFVPVNCGAIAETLVENELFGHARGAYTDAREAATGLVAEAEGGTLFLDEVEALPLRAQAALLRFLQDRSYRTVGGHGVRTADVRIVAASNVELEEHVQRHAFRSDLLFRLRVLQVTLPPLRERAGDSVLIANAVLDRLSREYRRPPKRLHPDAVAWIRAQPWTGNVRELENLLHREFLLTDGPMVRLGPRSDALGAPSPTDADGRPALTARVFREAKARAIADFERAYVTELLAVTNGNVSQAARISGKERSTLGRLMRKYGLRRDRFVD
jgi:DNA-binding NtrC family response regulator